MRINMHKNQLKYAKQILKYALNMEKIIVGLVLTWPIGAKFIVGLVLTWPIGQVYCRVILAFIHLIH